MKTHSKALSLFASLLLAATLILAPARFASAQDVSDEAVAGQPDKVLVPDIAGCWTGNAFNDSQGNTSISFFFQQTKNKISKKHSVVDLESNVPVHGPIIGKITLTQFKFHGHMANGCNIKGHGTFQMDNSITGGYTYVGKCFENQFTGGSFSKVVFVGPSCL